MAGPTSTPPATSEPAVKKATTLVEPTPAPAEATTTVATEQVQQAEDLS